MTLDGHVFLVAGGAGAIGGAIARALRGEGARVHLLDRAAPPDGGGDGDAPFHAVDLTDARAIGAAVDAVLAGEGRIHGLVNAAGVTSFGSAAELDEAEWDRVLAINLKGVFLSCRAVLPAMRAARYGRIVNIGSVLGKNGGNARAWIDASEQQRSGNIAYGVSKAGVHALTAYLARELAAWGITVNAVAPGPISSPMTTRFPDALRAQIPVGRMGRADEVAQAVAFLARPDSAFITGETLDINGGAWCD